MAEPFWSNGVATLYLSDSRHMPLPDESVHCCVTSPPYFGLRVYQGNDARGLGLEASVDAYLDSLMEVMSEVRRVLRDDGVLWVNLSDSYGGSGKGQNADGTHAAKHGEKQHTSAGTLTGGLPSNNNHAQEPGTRSNQGGQLLMVPERFCIRMVEAGWIFRDKVIWWKPAPMPEAVSGTYWAKHRVKVEKAKQTRAKGKAAQELGAYSGSDNHDMAAKWVDCPGCDVCAPNDGLVLHQGSGRCTRSYEPILMFTKQMGYFSDFEAVKTPSALSVDPETYRRMLEETGEDWYPRVSGDKRDNSDMKHGRRFHRVATPTGANRRNIWADIKPDPNSDKTCPECGRTFTKRVYSRFPKVQIDGVLVSVCPRCEEPLIAHYSTFPPDLPRLCIQASTSEAGACPGCGAQWARVMGRKQYKPDVVPIGVRNVDDSRGDKVRKLTGREYNREAQTQTLGFRPTCQCPPHQPVPPVVLDPFAGTCTTAVAAQRLGIHSVMVDLSQEYLAQGKALLLKESLPLRGIG